MTDHGRAHATLSPSSAERWLSCPASVRMIASIPGGDDGGSVYAEEGTRAHVLAEIEASYSFDMISVEDYRVRKTAWLRVAEKHGDDVEEMERHVMTYVSMLQDLAADMGDVTVRLEQRVQTGVPGCWGTADAVLISPRKVAVVDFKYGQGVRVHVEENPQAMLYAVGVLELLSALGSVETVLLGICQPRVSDGLTTWETTAESLLGWRDREVMPAARETQHPDARFGPSEEACRWCPASGECRPRLVHITQRDFGNPDILTPEEIADAWRDLPDLRDWCNKVEATALRKAYSENVPLPGLKVVLTGGKRSIPDPEAAVERLLEEGYTEEQVSRRNTKTLGDLEKLVGKDRLPEILGPLLKKGEGKPAIVPEDDGREGITAMTVAAEDFSAEE